MLWIAGLLPSVMQAAVPRVRADDAPAVTRAPSQWSCLAKYSPAALCSSAKRTGCLAAWATAACTEGGMMEAVSAV